MDWLDKLRKNMIKEISVLRDEKQQNRNNTDKKAEAQARVRNRIGPINDYLAEITLQTDKFKNEPGTLTGVFTHMTREALDNSFTWGSSIKWCKPDTKIVQDIPLSGYNGKLETSPHPQRSEYTIEVFTNSKAKEFRARFWESPTENDEDGHPFFHGDIVTNDINQVIDKINEWVPQVAKLYDQRSPNNQMREKLAEALDQNANKKTGNDFPQLNRGKNQPYDRKHVFFKPENK